jgi:SAM-dependent methyltransferase
VGCGTGIITAKIAELPGVAEAAGADPSPYFVERARRRASSVPHDPLQPCVEAAVTTLVHAPWLVRRLSRLVRHVGFQPGDLHSHGHLELDSPAYMPSLIDVGADRLATTETVSTTTAAALKAEARDRADRGRFFGHIAYASLLATRTP